MKSKSADSVTVIGAPVTGSCPCNYGMPPKYLDTAPVVHTGVFIPFSKSLPEDYP